MCRSVSLLPSQLKRPTSSPAAARPPAVLLLHTWDLPLWGEPPYSRVLASGVVTAGVAGYNQEGGGSHRASIGDALVQMGPVPSRGDPEYLVYPGLAFQPKHEGKSWETATVPAVGWGPSPTQWELNIALQVFPKSGTAVTFKWKDPVAYRNH